MVKESTAPNSPHTYQPEGLRTYGHAACTSCTSTGRIPRHRSTLHQGPWRPIKGTESYTVKGRAM